MPSPRQDKLIVSVYSYEKVDMGIRGVTADNPGDITTLTGLDNKMDNSFEVAGGFNK